MGPNSCAIMNRFWRWGSIGPRPRQWPGRLIPGLGSSPALYGGTGKRSRCLLGGGKSLNPLVLSKALSPLPQVPTTFVISHNVCKLNPISKRLPEAILIHSHPIGSTKKIWLEWLFNSVT